jgi:SAM-dependent methyltransferase
MNDFDINRYTQQYSEHYNGKINFERILVAIRRKKVLTMLQKYSHRKIIEIGCGMEPLFTDIKDFDECIIIEPSEEFVANARALAKGDSRISVIRDFFEDVPLSESIAHADLIIASSLLHEVPDPTKLLSSILRIMSDACIAHFNVSNVRSFHRIMALEMGLIKDLFQKSETETRFQRRTRFDKGVLTGMLEENGFEIVECSTHFVKPFTHEQFEKMLEMGIIDIRVIEGFEKMTQYMPDLGCELFVEARRKRDEPN